MTSGQGLLMRLITQANRLRTLCSAPALSSPVCHSFMIIYTKLGQSCFRAVGRRCHLYALQSQFSRKGSLGATHHCCPMARSSTKRTSYLRERSEIWPRGSSHPLLSTGTTRKMTRVKEMKKQITRIIVHLSITTWSKSLRIRLITSSIARLL